MDTEFLRSLTTDFELIPEKNFGAEQISSSL